jgi:uncharacterized repeat protein (TIGR02543 family)
MKKRALLFILAAVLLAACDGPYSAGQILVYEEKAAEYTLQAAADENGAITLSPKKDRYAENEKVRVSAAANSGYEFAGWAGDASGTDNPLMITVTADMWVSAVFEESLYYTLITDWDPIGGSLLCSLDGAFSAPAGKSRFSPGEKAAIRAVPIEGYQFDGWEGDIVSANSAVYITFDRNYQIYPKFSKIPTPVTYKLATDSGQGGKITRSPPKTDYYDGEIVEVAAVCGDGYIFAGWSGDYNGTEPSFRITMDSNKSLSASFVRREWTFAVYMAADNGLDSAALEDLNGLEAAARAGQPVTVIALADRITATPGNWSDTRLYEIKPDPDGKNAVIVSSRLDGTPDLGITAGSGSELDTANPLVLSGLIDYAKRAYPADNYGLIVWGHGLGWKGCVIDDTSGTSMSLSSLGAAVAGKGLSVIAFDTGLGVTLESAYEIRNAARYLVGSPNAPAGSEQGWDYESLFASFLESPSLTADAFCESVAGHFQDLYSATDGAGISVIDLSKTGALLSRFESFSGSLAGTITSLATRDSLYAKFMDGTIAVRRTGSGYPADVYADIYSLSLQGDGTALQSALSAAVSSWSKEHGTGRALLGVFVNRLASPGLFAPSHEDGYKKGTGTGAFVKDSVNWAPTGNVSGTSFLDKLFYGEYN